jgi:hypothetical protein
VRIAIHSQSAHEHPHLHHHILWAVFALIVLLLFFSRPVAGGARITSSGSIAAAQQR